MVPAYLKNIFLSLEKNEPELIGVLYPRHTLLSLLLSADKFPAEVYKIEPAPYLSSEIWVNWNFKISINLNKLVCLNTY